MTAHHYWLALGGVCRYLKQKICKLVLIVPGRAVEDENIVTVIRKITSGECCRRGVVFLATVLVLYWQTLEFFFPSFSFFRLSLKKKTKKRSSTSLRSLAALKPRKLVLGLILYGICKLGSQIAGRPLRFAGWASQKKSNIKTRSELKRGQPHLGSHKWG